MGPGVAGGQESRNRTEKHPWRKWGEWIDVGWAGAGWCVRELRRLGRWKRGLETVGKVWGWSWARRWSDSRVGELGGIILEVCTQAATWSLACSPEQSRLV